MSLNKSKLIDFFVIIGKLKATKRAGWVERKVRDPESVASHMYRMALISFTGGEATPPVNKDTCIKISLVHDLAECIVGDITPADNISKEEKHRQEKNAMLHLKSLLSEQMGQEIYQLWEEYELQSTAEARFVKDLDKFDMILQAYEYEQADNRPGTLQDFFNSTQGKFSHPTVQGWVEELHSRRQESLQAPTEPCAHSNSAASMQNETGPDSTISENADCSIPRKSKLKETSDDCEKA